ncbi:N-6 DNA methylase [Bradyrhizobium sp. CSS354]|uniref:N-6 DNA methylase n=1 Tax=Bradyrhizobium sp. CSS354 TaxID=2699172 RepID=UPI0023AEDDFE|nr:N-6 DNA methylase [Bradyrhizobium sp. CSS354]MDE5461348.1 N-6 DNA methylase [Bradyrhizobium sp. CSS354]
MTILSKTQRRQLETTIKQAREIAEDAAKEGIARLGVAAADAPARLSDDSKALRRRLRAHARTLGDTPGTGVMTTSRLQDATSYEIWHRMLFGRFLAERGLLIHPELGAAMSVAELRDLANEEGADEWALAEGYAAPGLPGVFKPDDPVLALPIAPEFSKRLRTLLSGLPEEVFTADDSLGWTYQFWRASEKDEVNAAGGKIGAAELPAVTQLFTESYMVKFLLHNTLGAWWAGKVLARDPDLARDAVDEDALREACAVPGVRWEFLRFIRDADSQAPWRPAAGTFPGWPVRAAEITYCDPCCGSGHFLVEAFAVLAALRRQEEGLSLADAAIAVLRDNLHGLELDGRCVQIAAFNVALAAWKLAGAAIALPSPHIAWVGAPPPMSRTEMAALANGDTTLRHALEALYDQFAQAPLLGSLLEVGARDLLDVDLRERGDAALEKLRGAEPERAKGAIAAKELLDASEILARRYVLLATNVPFLGRNKQNETMSQFIIDRMPEAKADLATAMLQRMFKMAAPGATVAGVSPQNWLLLGSYRDFRTKILKASTVDAVIDLGPAAFQDMNWWAARTALTIISSSPAASSHAYVAIDADTGRDLDRKLNLLRNEEICFIDQSGQRSEIDSRIVVRPSEGGPLLSKFAVAPNGMHAGDSPRYRQFVWEQPPTLIGWTLFQGTVETTRDFGGRETIFQWRDGGRDHRENPNAYVKGMAAWQRDGVVVSMMRMLPVTRYTGEHFDISCTPIVPNSVDDLPALWSFCSSDEFYKAVRAKDSKVNVTNATLIKIPFDIEKWRAVAARQFPDGLPTPYSSDPTQWIFHGHPAFAEPGTELQVALARLAGYRWPAEIDANMRLSELGRAQLVQAGALPTADSDGLLPLHGYGADHSLSERLRHFLAAAFGSALSPVREQELVRAADAKLDKKEARDATLETWLRDRAFRQHCILFQQRPFLWQVWDGLQDGFSAFLHYHRLDNAALNTLTYTLLGDWIRTAKAEGATARQERAIQLQQKLAKIIEGETPYDVFVRWKPLACQPLGWNPNLDEGVRLNIRPFMVAGILREQPRGITWNKDRGTDAVSTPWYDLGPRYGGKQGDRINDHHTTLVEKRAARGIS